MEQVSASRVPTAVKLASFLVTAQGLLLVAGSVLGVALSEDKRNSLVLASFYLLIAISLLVGAVAQWKRQRFSRALILVWQLFGVIIGVQVALGGALLQGIAAASVSGIVIILMFTKEVLRHTQS